MGWGNPVTSLTAAEVTAAVPSAATIDAQPNSAGAASQSAVARIRSMTRASFFMNNSTDTTVTVPISVTDINRCQINLLGQRNDSVSAQIASLAGVSAVSNTTVTLNRASALGNTTGFVEVMEWI